MLPLEDLILHFISQKWMVDSRLRGGMPEVGSGKRALSFLPLQYFDKKQRRGEKT